MVTAMTKPNSEYWAGRFAQLEEVQHKTSEQYLKNLQKEYTKAMKAIDDEVAVFYARYASAEGISYSEAKRILTSDEKETYRMTVEEYIKKGKTLDYSKEWADELERASTVYRVSRLQSLQTDMQQQLEALFGKQDKTTEKHLNSIYTDGYYRSAYEISKGAGVGISMEKLDNGAVNKILHTPWAPDGADFSERIWRDKCRLISEMQTVLAQGFIRGESYEKMTDMLAKRMDVARSRAENLVVTESAFFAEQARQDCMNFLEVEQYEIVATLDSKTSAICQRMDGKVFDMKDFDAGVTAPPFHCRCRTTTCPHFDDSDLEGYIPEKRAARDPETGKTVYVPGDMTYAEWKDTFVDDELQDASSTWKKLKKFVGKRYDDATRYNPPKTLKELPDKYKNDAMRIINNAPQPLKSVTLKHIDAFKFAKVDAIGGFRNNSKYGIYIDWKKSIADVRGKHSGLFHEMGHTIDRLYGNVSTKSNLKDYLQQDFDRLVNKYMKLYHVDRNGAYSVISKELKQQKSNQAYVLSDLFGGMTNNKCVGGFQHEPEYWEKPMKLEKEMFAHFYGITLRNDNKALNVIKQAFPSAYAEFIKTVGRLK